MFTGIIEAIGQLNQIERRGGDLSLVIDTGVLDLQDVKLGDSIAVNGVCLTVTRLLARGFAADVSAESLQYTNIGSFQPGCALNLEKALTLSTRLGGHLVSGHVDGIGHITAIHQDGRSIRYDLSCPVELEKYIATKGSITVDGVSLTVTASYDGGFSLNIVPHTLTQTILPDYAVGTLVHLEVDVIARYTERLLRAKQPKRDALRSNIDQDFLVKHGFSGGK